MKSLFENRTGGNPIYLFTGTAGLDRLQEHSFTGTVNIGEFNYWPGSQSFTQVPTF
jgi:hypothetical protein